MSEESTGLETTAGQPEAAPTGTTAPESAPVGVEQAPTSDESSFFDPNSIDPALQPAYKNMQASYTKKMQALAAQRKELEGFSTLKTAFERDPHSVLGNLAQQYGYTLTRAQQQAMEEASAPDWQPQSWDDVLKQAETRAEQRILKTLEPILGTVKTMKAQAVESQLDQIDPMWRDYEDQMTSLLAKHPTLSGDLATLYELSVPAEVRESRAYQKAAARMKKTQALGTVSGQSTKPKTVAAPPKVSSFEEAVAAARAKIANG